MNDLRTVIAKGRNIEVHSFHQGMVLSLMLILRKHSKSSYEKMFAKNFNAKYCKTQTNMQLPKMNAYYQSDIYFAISGKQQLVH